MNAHSAFRFLRIALGLVLLLSLALSDITPASAALRCYVKWNAAGTNNGTSWVNAYTSPQSVLSSSSACTEVWVAKGTYKPTTGTDRTKSFVLKNGVALYGGFAGTETIRTQRKPASNPTILSGDIGLKVPGDNSYHVVVGSGTGSTTRLDGFTITGGYANDPAGFPWDQGGGLFNESGLFVLANVTFTNNHATGGGGGMENRTASPTLTNVTFAGNSSEFGGGMLNYESSPSLLSVTFNGNRAVYDGGGMMNWTSSPSLKNVTFSGNSANYGGAIHNYLGSSPALMNVTLSGNSASYGAGMSSKNSNPTVTNSILYGDVGAEIYNDASTPVVTYSIIQGGYPGAGNLDANPLLRPLGNYGGFTRTRVLGAGSPAIDKGTNTGCPAADQRGIPRPKDGDLDGTATCDMGATESRLFTGTFPSIGAQDGWVLESTETSGVGGEMDSTDETFSVGDYNDRQIRSILSFNTSSLPDTAVITSAALQIKKHSLIGGNPFGDHGKLVADVRKGPFSNNAALQLTDFQAAASKNAALNFQSSPPNGPYSAEMIAANRVYINKTGLTQFRLRFAIDDNNDGNSDYLRFFSGNAATASLRPVLVIKYYIP